MPGFSFGAFVSCGYFLMGRDGAALSVMLASVFWGSLIPVFLALQGDLDSPFLFASSWRLGTGLSSLLGALVCLRSLAWRDRGVLLGAWRRVLCVPVVLTALGSLDYGLFLLSLRFISAPVATVLVEGHLLLGAVVLVFRSRGRYRDRMPLLFVLLFLGFLGVAFLVAAEYGGLSSLLGGIDGLLPLWGCLLAFMGAVALAPAYTLIRWADRVGRGLQGLSSVSRGSTVIVVTGLSAGNLMAVPFCLSIGLLTGEAFPDLSSLRWAFLGGFLLNGLTTQGWRVSLTLSSYVGVGALLYLIPLLALFWYWLLGMVDALDLPLLVSSLFLILGSSLLLQFRFLQSSLRFGMFRLPPRFVLCSTVLISSELLTSPRGRLSSTRRGHSRQMWDCCALHPAGGVAPLHDVSHVSGPSWSPVRVSLDVPGTGGARTRRSPRPSRAPA